MARVLVIDDEPHVLHVVKRMLQSAGHEVLEARNGEEGIRVYLSSSPDVVICDIFMPAKDGFETIRELRCKHRSRAGIIGITGGRHDLDWPVSLEMARCFGAVRVLLKPFQESDLLQEVACVLDGGEAARDAGKRADPIQNW